MELRLLRYFVAVAQELHFGRAAARLHIAQPPLTRQIKKLENELDVLLLRRTKRRVELTRAGEGFLQSALQLLAAAEESANAARRAQRGETGRLVVGYVLSTTYWLLPSILRLFRKRVPDVQLALHEMALSEMPGALASRSVDVGFLRPPVANAGIVMQVLLREPFVVAFPTGHSLTRRKRIGLSMLVDEQFITFSPHTSVIHHQVIGACHRAGFQPRIAHEALHLGGILGLVRSGVGIAILPRSARQQGGAGIEFAEIVGRMPKAELALAWRRSDASSPLVRAFVEAATEVAREKPLRV